MVLGWAEVGAEDDPGLSPGEREGLARCRTAKRRREFVAGRLAAHHALHLLEPGAPAEVRARAGGADAGRPVLVPERGLALSISHGSGLAVAALSRGGALGVDLEERVDASEAFLEEAFAPGERAGYAAVCGAWMDATTAAWALKEAVLKVWGVGLRAPLQLVALRPVLLHAHATHLALRVELRTGALPPGLGAPPTILDALLRADETGRVLAVAG